MEPTPFVLLFQGRTGSTFITECLNDHPHIRMAAEVWGGWGFQVPPEDLPEFKRRQCQWLTDYYGPPSDRNIRAMGFKTKLDDVLDKPAFIRFLRERQLRIIHMTRRNVIKLVVSEINAQRLVETSGKWNIDDKDQRPGPFVLDLEEFEAKLEWRLQVERWLDAYIETINLPTLRLAYEDLLDDGEAFFEAIYDFINVRPHPASGNTVKSTPDDLSRIILNYDALLSKYKYTPYEPMILHLE